MEIEVEKFVEYCKEHWEWENAIRVLEYYAVCEDTTILDEEKGKTYTIPGEVLKKICIDIIKEKLESQEIVILQER